MNDLRAPRQQRTQYRLVALVADMCLYAGRQIKRWLARQYMHFPPFCGEDSPPGRAR